MYKLTRKRELFGLMVVKVWCLDHLPFCINANFALFAKISISILLLTPDMEGGVYWKRGTWKTEVLNVLFQKISIPPQEWFFLEIPVEAHTFVTNFGVWDPHPLGISNDHLWGGYGNFVEPHNGENRTSARLNTKMILQLCWFTVHINFWLDVQIQFFSVDRFTASHHASLTGSSEVVIGLIELESDINARDHKGN